MHDLLIDFQLKRDLRGRRIQVDKFISFTVLIENYYCERLCRSRCRKSVLYTDETIGLAHQNFMGVAILKSIMKGSLRGSKA